MEREEGGASVRVGRFSFRIVARAAKPRKHSTAELIAHGIRRPGVYESVVRAIVSDKADSEHAALVRSLAVGRRVWEGSTEHWLFEQTGSKFRAVVPPRRVGTVVHHAVSSGMLSRKSSPLAIERTLRPMVLNVVARDVAHYSSRIAPGLAGKEKGTEKPMHPAQKKYMTKAAEAARKAATKPGTKGLPPNLAKQFRLPRGWYSNRRYRRAMRLLLGGRGFNYEDYAGRHRKKKTAEEVRKAAEGDKGKEKKKEESKKEEDEVVFHEGGDSDSYDSEEDVDLTREPSPKPPKKAAPAGTQKDPVEVESDSAPGSSKRNPIKVSSDGETEPVSDKPAGEEPQEQKQSGDAEEEEEMKREEEADDKGGRREGAGLTGRAFQESVKHLPHAEQVRLDKEGLIENIDGLREDLGARQIEVVNVLGDGSCLFHAASASIRSRGEVTRFVSGPTLRAMTINWMERHRYATIPGRGQWRGIVEGPVDLLELAEVPRNIANEPDPKKKWEGYINHIRNPRVFADTAMVVGLSSVLGREIGIVNSPWRAGGGTGKNKSLDIVPPARGSAAGPDKGRIYIASMGSKEHYLGLKIRK